MNITLQTANYNNPQYKNYRNNYNNRNQKAAQQNFTGLLLPEQSKLLNPFKKVFNKFTDFISEKYTTKLYTSKLAEILANKTDKLKGVVDHMQVIGSTIISGMYMLRTYQNKQLKDKDRKNTLIINQALTFGLSTFLGYAIDSSLDEKWEKFTQNYASRQLKDKDFKTKIKTINDGLIKEAEAKFGKPFKQLTKEQKPKLMTTLGYLEKHLPNSGMEAKIRGMGVLKKLVVFGTIYRFLGPVAVTPIANWMGNHLAASKKANEKAATNKAA